MTRSLISPSKILNATHGDVDAIERLRPGANNCSFPLPPRNYSSEIEINRLGRRPPLTTALVADSQRPKGLLFNAGVRADSQRRWPHLPRSRGAGANMHLVIGLPCRVHTTGAVVLGRVGMRATSGLNRSHLRRSCGSWAFRHALIVSHS